MPSKFKPYDRVRVVTDRFRGEGAPVGTVGYVIERWADGGLEVEVSGADGATIAQFVARDDDLELAEDEEHFRVVCPDCQGTKKCDTCGATGSWRGDVCPFCAGAGVCNHCGGKGFVTEAD